MRLAAVLRNLPIIHDQAVDDLVNARGSFVAASSSREGGLPTHRSRRRFSQATTGLPWNLTFARAGEKVVDGYRGRSRMPIDHRDNFEAERLHPKVTNWH
jgi:hypothetical protein